MRLGVLAAGDSISKRSGAEAVRIIRTQFPEIALRSDLGPPAPDVVIAIGDDHFLLGLLRRAAAESAVFPVGNGFISETVPSDLSAAIPKILRGEHWVGERLRLEVTVGGRRIAPALNEALLTTSRGGGFLRYTLTINGERTWRDGGDGIVICTPTGSTGYGLSAGGPVVMQDADAMMVVPLASAMGQRPVVVSKQSLVAISEVESRLGRDLVIDGQERIRLHESGFTIQVSDRPARIVQLGRPGYLRIFDKLRSARGPSILPPDAPPSSRFLFHLLSEQGPLTEKQLITESGLPERTVRSGLAFLIRGGFARRTASLRDAREAFFSLAH